MAIQRGPIERLHAMPDEPIAITGIACRFPGGITTPGSFWNFVVNRGDGIGPVPVQRKSLWSTDLTKEDYPGYGGFINDIDCFDARFFEISPREARYIDPQQRLLLELAWEAFEDAKIPVNQLEGDSVGVYTGIFLDEYWDLQRYTTPSQVDIHTNTGGTLSLAANRISYFLNFKGPSISVDTACSSSLTAIHLACRDIQSGTCSAALAGGVNLLLSPQTTRGFYKAQMLSSDGRCRAFDQGANGYGRSDGAGMVLLKSLDKALKDGDSIYAIIHGSAINQDGRTEALTLPDESAQENVINTAGISGGVDPHCLFYVEAHGTGTKVGDPAEANAIGRATGLTGCLIGSVKTNIGHSEAAAGVAGLIKTALSLKHGIIPPSLHFDCPNPNIPFDELGLKVVTEAHEIPYPVYAGVNSFGFGGANAHIILGSPPQIKSPIAPVLLPRSEPSDPVGQKHSKNPSENSESHLLLLSAADLKALKERASDTVSFLKSNLTTPPEDLAAAFSLGRAPLEHRLALVFETPGQAIDRLQDFCKGRLSDRFAIGRLDNGPTPIAFVFTGMGPQWYGMGQTLYKRYPEFRKELEKFDDLFSAETGWSIIEQMMIRNDREQIIDVEISQSANLALQWALASWWRTLGVKPQYVIGHSVGEISSACFSGALTLKEAIQIIRHRSRLQKPKQGEGEMLAVGMSSDEAREIIKPFGENVSIAATNSPFSVTIAGPKAIIENLQSKIEHKNLFCRKLNTGIAYHSAQMEGLHDEFVSSIDNLDPTDTRIPMLSTVTGGLIKGKELNAEHWWRNIREPVIFDQIFTFLRNNQGMIFLEIGAHPVLSNSIYENLAHLDQSGQILPSMRRDDEEIKVLSDTAGRFFVNGYDLNWGHLMAPVDAELRLPSYPWQKERYWLNEFSPQINSGFKQPFIGPGIESSVDLETWVWERAVNLKSHPILADHVVMDKYLLPLTGQIEMLWETVFEDEMPISFTDLNVVSPLLLPENGTQVIQIVRKDTQYEISSRSAHHSGAAWMRNTKANRSTLTGTVEEIDLDSIRDRCHQRITGGRFYQRASEIGFNYGAEFRQVVDLVHSDNEVLTTISTNNRNEGPYRLHPGTLDAGLQAMILLASKDRMYLPKRVQNVLLIRRPKPTEKLFAYSRYRDKVDDINLLADVSLVDSSGQPLVILEGVECSKTEYSVNRGKIGNPYDFYAEKWESVISWDQPTPPNSIKKWYVFTDNYEFGASLVNSLSNFVDKADLIDISGGRLGEEKNVFSTVLKRVVSEEGTNVGVIGIWAGANNIPYTEEVRPSLEAFELIRSVLGNLESPCYLRFITSMAQSVLPGDRVAPAATSIWGCARVVALEHPELNSTIIDLPENFEDVNVTRLTEILRKSSLPGEITLRGNNVYIRQLHPVDLKNCKPKLLSLDANEEKSYRLSQSTPGSIDNLYFAANEAIEPGRDEVSIRVKAVGLNFRDVLTALGILPNVLKGPVSFGWECVGEVIARGDNVKNVNVGDVVLGMFPAAMAKTVTIKSELVVRKPTNLSPEEAATIPAAFLTAYLGLMVRANLSAGESILIHNASGGVGLAAVQLAFYANTKVFATAGSAEKRDYLRAIGISEVMDSRSEVFAEKILEKTAGLGVDVILNTLPEPGMTASMSVLSAHGRFIEIGKTSIMDHRHVNLNHFDNNKSYHPIDLAQFIQNRPSRVGNLLSSILEMFSHGKLRPLPYKSYPMVRARDAFRFMAQARHIGKLVIVDDGSRISVKQKSAGFFIRPGGTYLVTGGTGGVGQFLVAWLIKLGAGQVIITGRRPEKEINLQSYANNKVLYFQVDVTDCEAMTKLFADLNTNKEPIRGVFHAAGILNDGILVNQSVPRFQEVLKAKIIGTSHLHNITKSMRLDLFVLFSSVASMVGAAGQGAYAAGNAYLDGLADSRRQLGLPVTTINWAGWKDTGMMQENRAVDRLRRQGLRLLDREEIGKRLEWILTHDIHRVGIIPLSDDAGITRISTLVGNQKLKPEESPPETEIPLDDVKNLTTEGLREYVENFVIESICSIVEVGRETIEIDQPWRSLGIDSLMAVEIRNRIEIGLQVSIEIESLQSSALINQTVEFILDALKATSRI